MNDITTSNDQEQNPYPHTGSLFGIFLKRRFWKWFSIAVSILLMITYIGLHALSYYMLYNELSERGWTKARYSEYKEFKKKIIEFPNGWMDDLPVVESTQKAFDAVYEQWLRISNQTNTFNGLHNWSNQFRNNTLSEEQWAKLRTELGYYDPFINSLDRFVETVDKELDRINTEDATTPRAGTVSLFNGNYMHEYSGLVILKSKLALHDNHPENALRILADSLYLSITNPKDWGYIQGWDYYHFEAIQNAMFDPIELSQDRETLRSVLDKLTRIDPWLYYGMGDQWDECLLRSRLKNMIAEGKNVEIVPGKNGAFYLSQFLKLNHPPQSIRASFDRLMLAYLAGEKHWEKNKYILNFLRSVTLTGTADDTYFLSNHIFLQGTTPHPELKAAQDRDHLRFQISAKLYFLDHNQQPKTWDELVPDYLSQPLNDRVKNEPYEWKAGTNKPIFPY